jgi:hypothetical protein
VSEEGDISEEGRGESLPTEAEMRVAVGNYRPVIVSFPALPDCKVTGIEVWDARPIGREWDWAGQIFCDNCDMAVSDRLMALYDEDSADPPRFFFCEACVAIAAHYAKGPE